MHWDEYRLCSGLTESAYHLTSIKGFSKHQGSCGEEDGKGIDTHGTGIEMC